MTHIMKSIKQIPLNWSDRSCGNKSKDKNTLCSIKLNYGMTRELSLKSFWCHTDRDFWDKQKPYFWTRWRLNYPFLFAYEHPQFRNGFFDISILLPAIEERRSQPADNRQRQKSLNDSMCVCSCSLLHVSAPLASFWYFLNYQLTVNQTATAGRCRLCSLLLKALS